MSWHFCDLLLSIEGEGDSVPQNGHSHSGQNQSSEPSVARLLQQGPRARAPVPRTRQVAGEPESSILAKLLGLLPALEDDGNRGGKPKEILLRLLQSFDAMSKDSDCFG